MKIDKNSLMRFWLTRLQEEFSIICRTHGVMLEPPVFEISSGTTQLGCWQSTTRNLRISEDVILSYPWSTTLQVLRHEMAHQYCSEVIGEETLAHGEEFQSACILLGVLPEFRGSRVLSVELLKELSNVEYGAGQTSTVLQKIEKLLALGESPNIHEAEAALQKASMLIDKYHVQHLKSPGHEDFTVKVIETGKKQVATYKRHICRILKDFFYVRVVLSEAYVPVSNGRQKTIEIMGTRENTSIAEYCYYFLENQLDVLWREFRSSAKVSGRTQKNSYYLGVVLGFFHKLSEQNVSPTSERSEQKELLVLEDRRLDSFVQMCFPRLRRSRSRSSRLDSDTYHKGMVEGRKLTLTAGVNHKKSYGLNYLE
ncbi:SprT-like domain-containing protein [Desulforhopalus sp. 52FAK]